MLMSLPFPDLRFETARDHLQQALAILPAEGSEVIRLLLEEASRRCEAKAYRNAPLEFTRLQELPSRPEPPVS
jgi:hypothetical protein